MKHLIWSIVSLLLFANSLKSQCSYQENVPDELNRKRYKESGMTYGNPYTMFNRKRANWSLESELANIRNILLNSEGNYNGGNVTFSGDNKFAEIYYNLVLIPAQSVEPNKCGYDQIDCTHPTWVKNNAIVYLLGIRAYVDDNKVKFSVMDQTGSTVDYRDYYFNRAHEGLRNLNPHIISCYGLNDCKVTSLGKSHELIYYLQAYDLLKAANAIPQYDQDRNGGDCTARNKLREFARNYYVQSEDVLNSFYGWKKNHGIIAASALGMAAIVLNDAGVETDFFNTWYSWIFPFGTIVRCIAEPMPHPKYSPKNWMERAHGNGGYSWTGGEDGIEDCFFTGDHAPGAEDVPQTNSDGTAGYAEGTGYFTYLLGALIPYMRTMDNFVPDGNDKNYLHQDKYVNILKWYQSILNIDETLPAYDNSDVLIHNALGALGDSRFPGTYVSLAGDFLLAMGGRSPQPPPIQSSVYNTTSGNIKLQMKDTKQASHYIHLLCEAGTPGPVDVEATSADGTHEDEDYGSYTIGVIENGCHSLLAIDPAYMGWGNGEVAGKTNRYKDHNVLGFTNLGDGPPMLVPADPISGKIETNNESINSATMGFTLDYNPDFFSQLKRKVKVYKTHGNVYYLMNDYYNGPNDEYDAYWQLNGNGNSSESTCTQEASNHIFKWTHPCTQCPTNGWNLLANISILDGIGTVPTITPTTGTGDADINLHGSGNNIVTNSQGYLTYLNDDDETVPADHPYGHHTRMRVTQNKNNTIFQSLLYPYNCEQASNPATFPVISRIETPNEVGTAIRFIVPKDTGLVYYGKTQPQIHGLINDTLYDLHLARLTSGTSTVNDPFNRGASGETIATDALTSFFSVSTYEKKNSGCCTQAVVRMNKTSIESGTFIEYNDTVYIDASSNVDFVEYWYERKFTYKGFARANTSVTFYMPDIELGYAMTATGEKVASSSHSPTDTNTYKYITVSFGGDGEFTLELSDPCTMSCFFPPTYMNIDTTFLFSTGTTETLGHDLDVIGPDGMLDVNGASSMKICPDFVFVNKNKIYMHDECVPDEMFYYVYDESGHRTRVDIASNTCNRSTLFNQRLKSTSRNLIVVSDRAALVLEDSSITQIGNNSSILIRDGGTLLVKAGAKLIIGDKYCPVNRGELLAEEGAHICVEPGAEITFYDDIDTVGPPRHIDTVDRNIVLIPVKDGEAVTAGVNTSGARGKFLSYDVFSAPGRWPSNNCIHICDWKDNGIGIANPKFGWSNINAPFAYFTTKDTFCLDDNWVIADGTKSLNERGYKFTAYTYDTSTHTCDSILAEVEGNDTMCLRDFIYIFKPTHTGHYRVCLDVQNDCGEHDSFARIIFVPPLPTASTTLSSSTICPGTGTLSADGSSSTSYLSVCKHKWSIAPVLIDTNVAKLSAINPSYGEWYIEDASVSNNFTFPGYNFIGGYAYKVSLTVYGWCGESTDTATVTVPLHVSTQVKLATTYGSPTGPPSFQLIGNVFGATSFSWTPSTYLDNSSSLTPISTPTDSICYILSATDGTCTMTDTVIIRHNDFAYTGIKKTQCYNKSVMLGPEYNGPVILGLLYYIGGEDFMDVFNAYKSSAPFEKYFTHYTIHEKLNDQYTFFGYLWNSQPQLASMILNADGFHEYYQAFVTEANEDAFVQFADVLDNNPDLKSYIDGLSLTWSSCEPTEIDDAFSNYVSWYLGGDSTILDITWEQNSGSGWSEASAWQGYYNRIDDGTANTLHRIIVTNNDYNTTEFDDISIVRDSIVSSDFIPVYQVGQTVMFSNTSQTLTDSSKFIWAFGDGDSSIVRNASHTFPTFGDEYVVCLTITNKCGNYTKCDTIAVDSSGIYNHFGYGKTGDPEPQPGNNNSTARNDNNPSDSKAESQVPIIGDENYLKANIPNPYSDRTRVEYGIVQQFKSAEIRITSVLGQLVRIYKLHDAQGLLFIDGSDLGSGMYFYTLYVDGVSKASRAMVVNH